MGKIFLIFQRDLREIYKTRAFIIISILASVITIAASITTSLQLAKGEGVVKEARPLLELLIGLLSYFIPLIILMACIWGLGGLQIVKEKTSGITSSLIATNLKPWEIWIGKSLAIFLPGYLMSLISVTVVVLSINLSAIVPGLGYFIFPLPLFLVSLIWNPLLLLGTLMFIILFSLAGNPDIASAPSFIVGFGLMMGIPLGYALGGIDFVSWAFSLWYLAGTVIVWITVIILTRFLTKENIVLSGKGN